MKCNVCGAQFNGQNARMRLDQHIASKHAASKTKVTKVVKVQQKRTPAPKKQIGHPLNNTKIRLGNTLEGSRWAYHALHPMSERDAGPLKIPDGATVDSTADEPRGAKLVACPEAWRAEGEGKTWDVQIAAIPVPEVPAIQRMRKGGTETWGPWTPIRIQDKNVYYGVTHIGHTDGSNPAVQPSVSRLPIMLRDLQSTRFTRGGMTITFAGSTLRNEGYVCSGSFGGTPKFANIELSDGAHEDQFTLTPADVLFLNEMPLSETDLGYLDKKMSTFPAREGCYIPFRFVSDPHLFKDTDGTNFTINQLTEPKVIINVTSGIPIAVRNVGVDPTLPINIRDEFVWDSTDPSSAAGVWDVPTASCVLNRQVAFAQFIGIDVTATLHVHIKDNFESVANPTTWLAHSQTTPPRRDLMALNAVLDFQRELPTAYPSRYNAENLLDYALFDVAPGILEALDPATGAVARLAAEKAKSQRNKEYTAEHFWHI